MDTDFDFKPINEGLGFHRKVKPLEADAESDESFSFSTLGPGTLAKPKVDANSREQSKGLLSSGAATSGKSKHNTKSVSDLIAALPPSLDLDIPTGATEVLKTPSTPSKKMPLFGASIDTPVAPSTGSASSAGAFANDAAEAEARGFLKLPLGRSDYGMKPRTSSAASAAILAASAAASAVTGRAPSSLDENVAKTFPTVFPHLGSLAGKPAAGSVPTAAAAKASLEKSVAARTEEHGISMHFGSAILDTLVAVGLGCVLLALSLSITNVNLMALLENSQTDSVTIAALAVLFIAGGLLYVLAARSFLGATLGEWSYEIRVGRREMRTRWFYPALVMWRGILVTVTGFILLPIISLIAGKDVLKYVTGLELVAFDEA